MARGLGSEKEKKRGGWVSGSCSCGHSKRRRRQSGLVSRSMGGSGLDSVDVEFQELFAYSSDEAFDYEVDAFVALSPSFLFNPPLVLFFNLSLFVCGSSFLLFFRLLSLSLECEHGILLRTSFFFIIVFQSPCHLNLFHILAIDAALLCLIDKLLVVVVIVFGVSLVLVAYFMCAAPPVYSSITDYAGF